MDKQKIVSIEVKNLQNVIVGKLHFPEGSPIVEVSGDNGNGKSSFLSGFDLIAKGRKGLGLEPVREGEKEGVATVEFTDLVVTAKINHKGAVKYLVEPKDGSPITTTRKLIDDFLGGIDVDPQAIMDKSPLEKFRMAMLMTGKQEEIDKLDADRSIVYQERATANKIYKQSYAKLQGMEKPDANLELNEIPTDQFYEEINQAHTVNAENQRKRERLDRMVSEMSGLRGSEEELKDEIAELQIKLKGLQDRIKNGEKTVKETRAEVEALEDVSVDAVQAKAKEAESINAQVRLAKEYHDQKESVEYDRKVADDAESELARIDQQKIEILKSASLPVDGLTVDTVNEVLRFKGVPVDQMSTAERYELFAKIQVALHPQAPYFIFRDASVIGPKIRKRIFEFALENGCQGIFESLNPSDLPGITFEDGIASEAGSK